MPNSDNSPRYDVIAIGNAVVDVISPCEEELIEELSLNRGGMTLIDEARAKELYDAMGPATETSGGSAANTLAGLSTLGLQCAFIGQIADDQLGEVFRHDIRATGIDFDTPARSGEPATGRVLIFVTPDGERTMNTFLGAGQYLPAAALDEELIADAAILYLEGYLWDPEEPRRAMRRAIDVARAAGRKIAFTASESFVIDRHGDDFRAMIEDGVIDILFVNEAELATLTGEQDFEAGLAAVAPKVPVLVATRSAKGAVAIAHGERAESPPNRLPRSSIRPALATSLPPVSCQALPRAHRSKKACCAVPFAPPKSLRITARARRWIPKIWWRSG